MGRFARRLRKERDRLEATQRPRAHTPIAARRADRAAARRADRVPHRGYELKKGHSPMTGPLLPIPLTFRCGGCGEEGEQYPDAVTVGRALEGELVVALADARCPGCGATEELALTEAARDEVLRLARASRDAGPLDDVETDVVQSLDVETMNGEVLPPAEGLAFYERLAAQAPRRPDHWLALAEVRRALQLNAAAVEAYERCLALDPGFAEAALRLAELHETQGRHDQALVVLDESWEERHRWSRYHDGQGDDVFLRDFHHLYIDCVEWVKGGGRANLSATACARVRWKRETDIDPVPLARFHYAEGSGCF